MRFCNQPHAFYAGIDLHARTMFTHILDHAGATVFERDLPSVSLQRIELADLLGLLVARRGFWDADSPNSPRGVWQRKPSLHGNVQRPDPV